MEWISGGRTTKKRRMDMISALPDSLISHILSFLPTKTAVSTSLLSRRWRHLWQHLQHFDFNLQLEQDLDQCDDDESFTRFTAFVSGVLAQRRVRDIRKFRLLCSYTHKSSLHERSLSYWLLAAIGPQLQDLHLCLCEPDPDSCIILSPCYTVPRDIFTCSSLVSLSLDGLISIHSISSVHLPSLKTLRLSIGGPIPMDMIFSGCPVLENLFLYFNTGNAPKIFVPSSLKRLTLNSCMASKAGKVEVELDA
ncbi:hypothetical protein PIB30_049762 [Stylosanthes scabra]|uniref:F-box domain-containing protein n=1 Tax=Stylosanthes scabra TaxID=79078 RepID=A0ABU6XHN4_9FABA|nr:hypothetical protein [Stylosanthes scabra]